MEGLISKMRNIHKSTPPSFSRRENAAAIVKAPPPGALTKGPDRKFPGLHPPLGGATSPSFSTNRRFAFPILALLAALALGLLFLLPGGLLQAQSAEQFFTYAENGDGPVATFTASDPEGATPDFWSLTTTEVGEVQDVDIADNALFKIDQNGVLSFKSSPNYEVPGDSDGDRMYRVTVQVSDGSEIEYFEAYVSVMDVEETGKVTWIVGPDGSATLEDDIGLQQFQPGAQLLASVTDPDAATSSEPIGTVAEASITSWKWYRGSAVISGETLATYTVGADDVGMHIRVEATYSDGNIGPAETVSFTSPHPVQAFRRPADNARPVFSPTVVTRRVAENSTGNVGGPVTATDGDGDRLTYTLGGTNATSFKIDAATGQLMVRDDLKLNHEMTPSYTVEVTATDSSDTTTTPAATVTINVIDIDEKPTFATTSPTDGVLTAAGVVMPAQTEGNIAINALTISNGNAAPATLVASDPEGEKITLSLMGDDASSFELADDGDDTNAVSQALSFKEKPDFEMPGDRNRDNVYEVTVRASDGTMHADRALIIKVIDADEGGKVTVSPADAVVGVELTATLAHMEGGVAASGQIANQMWQWQTATAPTDDGETCAANTVDGDYSTSIIGATKATYTPVSANAGVCLRAMVTYNYQFAADATTASSDGTLVLVSQTNQAPKFEDGTRTFRVVMESVMANADDDTTVDAGTGTPATNDNVGSAIVATDANGDTPTYTLGGADASLFRIRSDDGQLEVKDALDHETDSSHTVRVMANDGSGASNDSATITVTIYVTDADEAPTIKDRADSTAQGERTIPYGENGDGPVATFTASDPEDATPDFWSLTTTEVGEVQGDDIADNALFKIDQNGVLRFKSSPNYEVPGDSDGDRMYRVTVQVSDGNQIGYFEVTVNVTEEEETGKVTWIVGPDGPATLEDDIGLQQFQPGAQLLASVTDPDAATSSEPIGTVAEASITSWKWYRGSAVISGETLATYTVGADDVGMHIRVEATYSDGNIGPVETRRFTSPHPVQASRQSTDNARPVFSPTVVTRRVAENSTGNVGGPVTATDGDGDRLTYTLGGTNATSFKIDAATGQLMVRDDLKLNHEMTPSYTVEVTATDSSDTTTTPAATVTINVIDIDEKPTFATTSPTDGVLTAAGVVMPAQTEGNIAINALTISNGNAAPATLVASDPEGEKITLSLMGDDASSFELADDGDDTNAVSQALSFKEKPDFEMPGDRNRDNVYEVTVRASDGTMHADRALIIKVIDADEGGKVTVSPADAVVGVELTATLAHMEGGVAASGQIANQMWQWQTATAPTDDGETCAANTVDGDYSTSIIGATKATYTPVSANAGVCLRAMVTYNYQFAADTITASSAGALILVSQANQAPKFKEGTSTFRVVMESVMANAADDTTVDAGTGTPATNDNVGRLIEATDANGDDPTYILGGAGASLFRVRSNGQIEVKGKLDHETNASHTVTLTANDGSGTSNNSATITVTIYVTDVDEKPDIMVVPTENQAPVFSSSSDTRSILEGQSSGRPIGATVTATDLNPGDSLTYTLEGTDAASFSIHSRTGQLRTSDPLDQGTKSTYTVTVRATDRDGLSDTITVTITVTEAEEQMGEVTLWASASVPLTMAPQVGETITGAVMDPDGGEMVESWKWARSMNMTDWDEITGATDATYMTVAMDEGYYLRVMATYTDAVGMDTAMVYSMPTLMVVGAEAGDTLLERYDDGDDGWIQLEEARVAVGDYFLNPKGSKLSLEDARKVVGLYFEYKRQQ